MNGQRVRLRLTLCCTGGLVNVTWQVDQPVSHVACEAIG